MIVTSVKEAGKGRWAVSLDGRAAFLLYRSEAARFGIALEAEISGETYRQILEECLLKRAKARSLYLLKNMDRTEAQMRGKLREWSYPEEVGEEVIRWLYSFHYLDDLRYARSYVAQKNGVKSRMQLLRDLQARGVSRETAQEALSLEGEADETELVRRWIEKKIPDPEEAGEKDVARLYQFLLRRGFQPEDIRREMEGAGLALRKR